MTTTTKIESRLKEPIDVLKAEVMFLSGLRLRYGFKMPDQLRNELVQRELYIQSVLDRHRAASVKSESKPTTTEYAALDEFSEVKLWGSMDIFSLPSTCINLLAELWVRGWNPSKSDPFVYRPDSGELAYTCRKLLRRYLGTSEIREQAKRIGDLTELLYLEEGSYDYGRLPESLRKHHQLGE